MISMTTKRSVDGGMNRLDEGVLVAALLGCVTVAPVAAVAQGKTAAVTTPAAPAGAASAARPAPGAQPDAAVLLERARKKVKVDHDVAGAVVAYREVIEKHRADLASARPALRELLDLWVVVQGNEAAAAAIRPAAEKYLDMQRPIDPKAAAARTDDDLTRDLLLKPWLVTLKFNKAPLKEVLAEINRQSGVAIELGTPPGRAYVENLRRYPELSDQERRAIYKELTGRTEEGWGDFDKRMLDQAAIMAKMPIDKFDELVDRVDEYDVMWQHLIQAGACEVTINVNGVTALAALDTVAASVSMPLRAYHRSKDGYARLECDADSLGERWSYHGRTRIQFVEEYAKRTSQFVGKTRKSMLEIPAELDAEPWLSVREWHVRSAIGTDSHGRRHLMKFREANDGQGPWIRNFMVFEDVPADVTEFVTLTGDVAGAVIAEREEYRLPLVKGSRVETAHGTLTVLSSDTYDPGSKDRETTTSVTFAHRKDRSAAGVDTKSGVGFGVDSDDFLLEVASGKRIEVTGAGAHGNDTHSQHQLEFATGSAEPTALIWAVPTKEIAVTIPFEFKNVKLP